jgi:hypothetical protein
MMVLIAVAFGILVGMAMSGPSRPSRGGYQPVKSNGPAPQPPTGGSGGRRASSGDKG